MITNFSQCWALYCLVLFYIGLKNELKPLNPVGKFIAVKAIVFFSFWQSVAVALLVRLGFIADADIFPETSDSTFLVAATQDFLICIEMFVFACYHHSVFSYKVGPLQTPDPRPYHHINIPSTLFTRQALNPRPYHHINIPSTLFTRQTLNPP